MTAINRRVFLRNSTLTVAAAAFAGQGFGGRATKAQVTGASRPAVPGQRTTYLWPAALVPRIT